MSGNKWDSVHMLTGPCVSVTVVIQFLSACSLVPRSGELRTQKLKSHLVRTQSLNVLPLKPGVGQYIAIHATLTARDFFFAYFYPSSPFTCIFSPKLLPVFFPVLAVVNTWFLCMLAEYNRSPCWMQVPVLSARGTWIGLKNMTCGMMTSEMNDLEIE